jgi:UDP-N-acetylmuramoylalanine-D-glutamate ligase
VLTSLYPEHIDWHLTLENYFRDKINLLSRGKCQIVNHEAAAAMERLAGEPPTRRYLFNDRSGFHLRDTRLFDGNRAIGEVPNPYLARLHNKSNLCAALAVMKSLSIDPKTALDASGGFRGLAHRQEELGEIEGVLFVDDSISTIPESTLAALAVYEGRDITLILGGYDRGIEYGKLVAAILGGAVKTVICLGNSGERIYSLAWELTSQRHYCACNIHRATSMEDAVLLARRVTSPGGVVLLSPAAPSYGQYRDYIERGRDFAAKAGLRTTV